VHRLKQKATSFNLNGLASSCIPRQHNLTLELLVILLLQAWFNAQMLEPCSSHMLGGWFVRSRPQGTDNATFTTANSQS